MPREREPKELPYPDDLIELQKIFGVFSLSVNLAARLMFYPTDEVLHEVQRALSKGADWKDIWEMMHRNDASTQNNDTLDKRTQADAAELNVRVQQELLDKAYNNTTKKP